MPAGRCRQGQEPERKSGHKTGHRQVRYRTGSLFMNEQDRLYDLPNFIKLKLLASEAQRVGVNSDPKSRVPVIDSRSVLIMFSEKSLDLKKILVDSFTKSTFKTFSELMRSFGKKYKNKDLIKIMALNKIKNYTTTYNYYNYRDIILTKFKDEELQQLPFEQKRTLMYRLPALFYLNVNHFKSDIKRIFTDEQLKKLSKADRNSLIYSHVDISKQTRKSLKEFLGQYENKDITQISSNGQNYLNTEKNSEQTRE